MARVEQAGEMLRARTGFEAVLLGDGTILAVGDHTACLPGPAEPGSETAERYDPTTNAWSAAQSLNKPRKSFAMVPLRDGGAVVVGGINPDDVAFSSTKLFDPASGTWSDGPLLAKAVGQPFAATLTDGRVLTLSPRSVGETGSATGVEVLAPGAGRWEAAAEVDMYVEAVVAMTDGRLLAKGSGFESPPLLSIYDPSADRWTSIDAPIDIASSLDFGSFGSLVPLDDGGVLALSVARSSSDPFPSSRVERFDATSGTWSEVESMSVPRETPMIARLVDGRIFVAGGAAGGENEATGRALASSEIYDPATDSWTPGPDLLEPRKEGHATQLADGSILIYGGDADFNIHGDVPWCPAPMTSVERVYLGERASA